ncbi:MAG TPA: cytochrome c biogenesis protein CcdA [Dehalococcoidia bacterium]
MDVSGPVGPVLAVWAGVVSVASPCVLPLVPVYLAHLAGTSVAEGADGSARWRNLSHALAFVVGFSVVFVVLGASVGLAGYVLRDHVPTLSRAAGVLLIFFGLHVAGILKIPALQRTYEVDLGRRRRAGYVRSFLIGAAFSLGWTPCVGPILGGILTLAYTSATVWHGTLLLVFYSAGLALPFLLAGLALDRSTAAIRRVRPLLPVLSGVSGALLVAGGVLIFLGEFTVLNQYLDFFGLGARGV